MNRFNLKFFKRFWAIAKLYWLSQEKWIAFALLAFLIVLLIASTKLGVELNAQSGNIFSALSAKKADLFWESVKIYFGILVVYVPLVAGYSYVRSRLGLNWRKWLTENFLDKYFGNRAFYELGHFKLDADIDNPDQRIAEDIRNFCQTSLSFLLTILGSIFDVIGFSVALWGISQTLVFFLIVYSVIGTLVTVGFFGQVLVKLNFEQLKREANFRFGLVRIRENAEAIAFYRGERQESNQIKWRFNEVFNNFKLLILWQDLYLGLCSNTFQFIPYILPAIIVGSSVLAGDLEIGKVREAQGAFLTIFLSLNIIVSQFDALTGFAAGIDRLYFFEEYLEKPQAAITNGTLDRPRINTLENGRLAVERLTLQTPNYQRTLFRDISVELQPGQGLLVMGTSGCGKSSLLRAIAGLWNSGTGTICRPKLEEILFLPQRPYMILGNLRAQLLYPNTDLEIGDEELELILQKVNLANLSERFGGFDADRDWSDVLSLGEQQRLAFARLLVTKPRYAILDEATSALDIKNEANLYRHLQQSNTTFISVGHRPTLLKYHQMVLEISEEEKWKLSLVEDGGNK
jgi:putative ATP-binding cassette transporter